MECDECVRSFGVLGLEVDASPDDVRAAFRDFAKMFHPDKFPNEDPRLRLRAEQEFKKVRRAYDHISGHSNGLGEPSLRSHHNSAQTTKEIIEAIDAMRRKVDAANEKMRRVMDSEAFKVVMSKVEQQEAQHASSEAKREESSSNVYAAKLKGSSSGADAACEVGVSPPSRLIVKRLLWISFTVVAIVIASWAGWSWLSTHPTTAQAQYVMGWKYTNGNGVERDDAEAVYWLRKAAEQGYANAQIDLARRYIEGRGITKDDAEAARWTRKAAEQGDEAGIYQLANMYAAGQGVRRDDAEAVQWWRKAADVGDSQSQFLLGECYNYGCVGLPKNSAQADVWYRKAAASGSRDAQAKLAGTTAAKEREEAERLTGTPIDFASLYAKAYGTGLEVGKRYRVHGRVNSDLTGFYSTDPTSSTGIYGDHDFDDDTQMESVMRMAVDRSDSLQCTLVVSMGNSSRINIHRAEDCF